MGTARWRSPWVPALVAVAAAVSLLAPWARSGRADRSSIELLATAGALDVLSTPQRVLAITGWYLVVAGAAASLIAAAWDRRSAAAALALPAGPALLIAWVIVGRSPLGVRWGAPLGAALGVTATMAGVLVLMGPRSGPKEPHE